MKIKIIDPTICQTDSPKELKEFLTVKKTFWKKGRFNTERQEYDSPLVDKKGFFLAGFLPRVLESCQTRKIPVEIEGSFEKLTYDPSLKYPTITLFDDQKILVEKTLQVQRGIIQSPTGTGKTVLCYAILHSLKSKKSLVICPSKSIMSQTAKEFREHFGMKTSVFGDGAKDLSGDIVVGLINSLNKMNPAKYVDLFDVVIVDECHHCGFDGMYEKFLTHCLAPTRIGLTATTHNKNSEKGMAAEGLLGPIIGNFSFQDAVKAERIVMPKLVLLPVPKNNNIQDLRTYQDIYKVGIVNNRIRNGIITRYVQEEVAGKDKIAIVFVRLIEHANILQGMISAKGVSCEIVEGSVSSEQREAIKTRMSQKTLTCAIATAAWKEGLNLPLLSTMVNAAGYKDAIPVKQMMGRATRIVKSEKEEATVVDLLDIGKYLSSHCIERLHAYHSLGML